MTNRRTERKALADLLAKALPDQKYNDIQRLTTALLDSGYRNSASVLNEAADAMRAFDPAFPVKWLRARAEGKERS